MAKVQAWLRSARPAGDFRAWQGSVWTDLGLLISLDSGSVPFPEEPLNTRSKFPAGLVRYMLTIKIVFVYRKLGLPGWLGGKESALPMQETQEMKI